VEGSTTMYGILVLHIASQMKYVHLLRHTRCFLSVTSHMNVVKLWRHFASAFMLHHRSTLSRYSAILVGFFLLQMNVVKLQEDF